MCRENFKKCVDYFDNNLHNLKKQLPRPVYAQVCSNIDKVRDILNEKAFNVNKVETIINEIKDSLFSALTVRHFNLIQWDITDQDTDAIVNAANTKLILGSWVAGAIRKKWWYKVQAECDKIIKNNKKPIEIGKVATTTTWGNLKPQIIHAAVMDWWWQASYESIRKSVRNVILEAKNKGFKTISIPAFGTWVWWVSPEKSAEAIKKWLYDVILELSFFDELRIVAFDNNVKTSFQQIFN